MSRKRVFKKLAKRQTSVVARLEELYLEGAAEDFAALAAAELEDPAASSLAAEWTEMAEIAVREHLAHARFDRLLPLLRPLRRTAALRPLTLLAEAVVDLDAGHLTTARHHLAELAGGEHAAGFPWTALASLQALLQEEPEPEAARDLFRNLQHLTVEGFAPSEAGRQELRRSVEAVRGAVAEERGEQLLDDACRHLSLLDDLAALLDRVAALPAGDRPAASSTVAAWLQIAEPRLLAVFAASGPPLLAPLRHAVRLRWRAVLDQVAAREGPPGLAVLCTSHPRLLAHDVDLPRSNSRLREAVLGRQLLATRRYEELAGFLQSRSQTAGHGELAVFWSLELWAIGQLPDLEGFASPPYRAILRLQQMAGEIGRRFPRDQQTEMARALRTILLDLCQETYFARHVARAAQSLLEHLPDDAGLLMAAIAGAVTGEDGQALRALDARLARGVRAQANDLPTARTLLAEIACEPPWDLAPILRRVRLLFPEDAWGELADLVALEMGDTFASSLQEETIEGWDDDDPGIARPELEGLRPILGGTVGFAAIEVVLDGWRADRRTQEKKLAAFLAAFPGLDAPLAAFRVLERALFPEAPQEAGHLLQGLARAVIDRLDGNWQLWAPVLPSLVMIAMALDDRRRLAAKLRQLLASPDLTAEGREILEPALRVVADPELVPQAPGKPRARRTRTGIPQLRLDP